MAATDVSEQLAREDSGRSAAIAGAVAGAVLPLTGAILGVVALSDQPNNLLGQLAYVDDKAVPVILTGAVTGLGALGIMVVLRYLYAAAVFRRPQTPRVAYITATFGPPAYLISQVGLQIAIVIKAGGFADSGEFTYDRARDVIGSGAVTAAQALGLAAQLAMGFAFVLVSLNAMRAGLLTRFMGFVGVIVGVLFVIPIGSPLPVVQTFWLLTVAYLISGRWPNGVPPAWETGEAHPWQTMAEQTKAAAEEREARPVPDDMPDPELVAEPERPIHTRSKKKKRKR